MKDDRSSDHDAGMERIRERRRRINQAFRDGDLRVCLAEIQAEIKESEGESDLLKALPKVQLRYLKEVIEPLVEANRRDEAAKELDFVVSAGVTDDGVERAVEIVKGRIASLRTEDIPSGSGDESRGEPEQHRTESEIEEETEEAEWREAHAVLRQGEQAWAEGKKRQARLLIGKLDSYEIDDHDFVLRRDGLKKLLDESETHLSRPSRREASAGRWVLVLALILACALIAVFLLDQFSEPEDTQEEDSVQSPRTPDSVRAEPDVGYMRIAGVDSSVFVLDEDDAIIGRAIHILPVPTGTNLIRIRSEGYQDTVISLEIGRSDTIDLSISLRPKPPPRGWVVFRSRPSGASVFTESGEVLGTTPLDSVGFAPGSYRFTMKKPGFVPTSVDAVVRDSELRTVMGELPVWHDTGRFQLNSRPWAYVFVNGDSLGPTPLTTPDMPTATTHEFLLRASDGRELTHRLRLDPARSSPTPVTVSFPEPGILAVSTVDSLTGVPMWARISADSHMLGESPAEFSLNAGRVTIRAERDGYRAVERVITIEPGQRVTLTLALPPYRS